MTIGKNRNVTMFFLMLAPAFISGGMALNEYVPYSSAIGWLLAVVSQIIAIVFVARNNRMKRMD